LGVAEAVEDIDLVQGFDEGCPRAPALDLFSPSVCASRFQLSLSPAVWCLSERLVASTIASKFSNLMSTGRDIVFGHYTSITLCPQSVPG